MANAQGDCCADGDESGVNVEEVGEVVSLSCGPSEVVSMLVNQSGNRLVLNILEFHTSMWSVIRPGVMYYMETKKNKYKSQNGKQYQLRKTSQGPPTLREAQLLLLSHYCEPRSILRERSMARKQRGRGFWGFNGEEERVGRGWFVSSATALNDLPEQGTGS